MPKLNGKKLLTEKREALLWIALGLNSFVLLLSRIFLEDQNWLAILLAVTAVLLVGGLLFELKKNMSQRAQAFGLQSITTFLLVFFLVGLVNFLAYRYPQKVDLTSNQLFTLSSQTRTLVESLQTDVRAVLFSKAIEFEKYRMLLDNFRALSPKIKVEMVDGDKEVTRTRQAGVKRPNTLQLIVGERSALIQDPNEEKITNELVKLTRKEQKTFCALTGHGERNFKATDAEGYDVARKRIEDQSYQFKAFNLAQEGKVPQDCNSVGIVGPQRAFFEKEIEALSEYLNSGGRALLSFDIALNGRTFTDSLNALLAEWHVKVINALVVDPLARLFGRDASVAILANYAKDHSITRDTEIQSPFKFSRPVEILPGAPASLKVKWLAKTTPTSWGETSLADIGKGVVKYNEGSDKKGPLNAAVAVEGKKKDQKSKQETRLVVFGSSWFADNNMSRYGGNLDLFINSVSWLMEDEDLISIAVKKDNPGQITLSANMSQMILWGIVIIMPLMIFVTGIVIWRRRKSL